MEEYKYYISENRYYGPDTLMWGWQGWDDLSFARTMQAYGGEKRLFKTLKEAKKYLKYYNKRYRSDTIQFKIIEIRNI